jgi:hypothetical protein
MAEHPAAPVPPHANPQDQGAAHLSANAALKNTVTRLLRLLEQETAALRQRQRIDMDELSDRKNQALLELSRVGRALEREGADPELRPLLAELRATLDENRSVLHLHLRAVGEVADVLAAAIRDAESDGTYSTGIGGYSERLS